jgi:hypothetical protein
MDGEGRNRPDPPLFSLCLSARCRPAGARQRVPTVPRRHEQAPPARPQGRRTRLCPCTSPEPPAPATYWTPLPPTSWPIKSPSEPTIKPTPAPAASQTTSLPPVRSRSQLPAPPASYWTRVAPPRSAAVGRTDAGKWRRSAAGTFSAPRRRVLLPLRPSPSPSSSLLPTGELPP